MSLQTQTEGEFKGWEFWDTDDFENRIGPFYFRREEDGNIVGAFRAEQRHMNGNNSIHGGCLMSFADFALFAIPQSLGEDIHGVTVTMNSEFIGGAVVGELMEARGEILRAGGSLIFVRGLITANQRPCLNFSGTLKRMRRS